MVEYRMTMKGMETIIRGKPVFDGNRSPLPEAATGKAANHGSRPALLKLELPCSPNSDVVEHPDSEDLCRSCHPVGAFAVFPRWRRISGRLVVQEYDRRRAAQQC
jgi:hypothetical protein